MKVYFPKEEVRGVCRNIFMPGIANNPRVTLCSSEEDAELILISEAHIRKKYRIKYPEKTALLDYKDSPFRLNAGPLLYFKSSVVDKGKMEFVEYRNNIRVIPISYCLRQEVLDFDVETERDLDVCFIPRVLSEVHRKKPLENLGKRALKVLEINQRIGDTIQQNFDNSFVGNVGDAGGKGRNIIQTPYFEKLLGSKIVVTCIPPDWEGDYRLFEALGCGPLVLVDEMLTPVKNAFEDGKHLVYYKRDQPEDLIEKLRYYLDHEDERQQVALQGYEYAKKHHKPIDRIDEVLDEFVRVKGTYRKRKKGV